MQMQQRYNTDAAQKQNNYNTYIMQIEQKCNININANANTI